MSKIGRIYQGLNEIQKYYKGGVLQKLFFDWKHYIGTELNIEYGKECAGRNVVINGKTYQNLFKAELSQGHTNSSLTAQRNLRVNSEGFTLEVKTYTISVPSGYEILVYKNYVDINSVYIVWANKIVWSNSSKTNNVRIMIKKTDNTEITVDEVIGKVVLLESDYTDIDIPSSIDGIESVAEREIEDNNLITEMIVGWCNIATGNVEGCPESYPNSKVSNLIEINPNIKYKSNILSKALGETTGTDNLRIRCFDENKNYVRFTTEKAQWLCDFNDFYNHKDIYKSIKYMRILVLDSSLEVEEPYVIKGNINRFTYPTTIRNYNYQCETDGVVLPNGVKNSIDIIDGKKVHVQRVGKVLIDGTKTWNKKPNFSSESYMVCYFSLSEFLINAYRDNIISNYRYIVRSYPNSEKEVDTFTIEFLNGSYYNTSIYCGLKATSIDEFRNRLNENPIIIYYQLEEPIYTPLYDDNQIIDSLMLPNGVQDELILTASGFKRIKKMQTIILNGTENWVLSTQVTNANRFYFFPSITPKPSELINIVTDNDEIIGLTVTQSNKGIIGICATKGNCALAINTSLDKGYTVDTFKEYLSSNPITVTYELDKYTLEDTTSSYPAKNDTFGITLPLGQKDEIKDGYIYKSIFKLVIDDNSIFNFPTSLVKDNTVLISMAISSITKLYDATISAISDKLKFKNIYDLDETGFFIDKTGKNLYCRLPISIYGSTLEEIKQGLSENPITIWYPTINTIKIPIELTYKLDEPLRSLPNGVCDTIEEGKIVRRVGMGIFNGSDNVKLGTDAIQFDGYFTGTIAINNIKKSSCLICDKFLYSSINSLVSECIFASVNVNTGIRIRISNDKATNVATFKTWLSENPVTVYYELETLTEQEMTPDMILINGEPITDTINVELPNGVKDIIENGCYVKRVGKVVFDGSSDEEWRNGYIGDNKNNRFQYKIRYDGLYNVYQGVNNVPSVCDSFNTSITAGIPAINEYRISFSNTDRIIYILFNPSTDIVPLEDISAWKAWLSENPVTVWYELTTPVKIPLFSIKEGLTTLKSTNNITPQMELDCLVRDDFQNLCDNVWEKGNIEIANGSEATTLYRIRLVNYIEVQPNTTYRFETNMNNIKYHTFHQVGLRQYTANKTYIKGNALANAEIGGKFTTMENCYYIKFIVETPDTNYRMYLRPVK